MILKDSTKTRKEFETAFDFRHFRCIRLRCVYSKIELRIDEALVQVWDAEFSGGRIGYKIKSQAKIGFTAFTDYRLEENAILPGVVFPTQKRLDGLGFDEESGVYYQKMEKGDVVSYRVLSPQKARYKLVLYGHVSEETILEFGRDKKRQTLHPLSGTYRDLSQPLGILEIEGEEEIPLKMLAGSLEIKALRFLSLDAEPEQLTGFATDEGKYVNSGKEACWLTHRPGISGAEIEFCYEKIVRNRRFGILFNVTHYSSHPAQCEYPFVGYLVGFKDHLLIVEKATYGLKRIFDKPYKLEEGKRYRLAFRFDGIKFTVYFNDEFAFECFDSWSHQNGNCGLYADENCHVEISNIKFLGEEQ